MYSLKTFFFILFLLFYYFLSAQNYQAINGSSYGGSLGTGNNPASIVNVPYAWDITPVAVQIKQSTNAIIIKNYSLFSSPKNADVSIQNGSKKRFFFSNENIHLLNTRINLNANAAIAFGANIRNYVYIQNSKANWQDTVLELADFMKNNVDHLPISGESVGSSWAEFYGTYAQKIFDDGYKTVNGGITIKVNRALAGGYANMFGINYSQLAGVNDNRYLFTSGNLQYGYSSNFDVIDNNKSFADNRKAFLQDANYTISADIGIEYLLSSIEDDEPSGDDTYDTKIGISILDLGSNKYLYGIRSRSVEGSRKDVTDVTLENKFSRVRSLDDFNDSLATVSNSIAIPVGSFSIYQPTRLVVNVDKHVAQSFFVNAELTIPVISLSSQNALFIKDMNLLALTPRWETKSLGGYFPLLVNAKGQIWIGGAFKAGPVLFGIHNLSDLFSKSKSQNGGVYLAITVRPGKKYDRAGHYPRPKLTRKEKRSLSCPVL